MLKFLEMQIRDDTVPFISSRVTLPATHTDGKETSITPTPDYHYQRKDEAVKGRKEKRKRRNSPEEGDNRETCMIFLGKGFKPKKDILLLDSQRCLFE